MSDLLTPVEQHDVVSAIAYGELPLYRAQYECRHCLERFITDDYNYVTTEVTEHHLKAPPVTHNCTPDIIGVADLQCFVKQ